MRSLFLQDVVGDQFSIKDKVFYALVAGFLVTLYFPTMPVINNIFTGLLVVHSCWYNSFREKWQLLRSRIAVQCMLLFFLLHLISALFSANKQEAIAMLLMRSPLLLFPFAFGTILVKEELKNRIWWLYAVVTTCAAIMCLVWALVVYGKTGIAAGLYNDSLSEAIGKQSIYFAMMINVAIFSLVYLLSKNVVFISRSLAYASICLLVIVHFLLASRISIMILYTGLIIYAAYYIFKKRKLLEGLTLFMGLLIGGFLLIKFFPKTFNRFHELSYTNYTFGSKAVESHYDMAVTADQWNGANIRLAVWQCGWELAKENLLFGVGLGDKMDELVKVYRTRGFEFGIQSKRNLHNNYFDILVTFGVTGLLIFVAGYLALPFIRCVRTKDTLGSIIILALSVALISETYLDRSIGNIVCAFFIPFVISYQKADQ